MRTKNTHHQYVSKRSNLSRNFYMSHKITDYFQPGNILKD